jgi:hypothetical protein
LQRGAEKENPNSVGYQKVSNLSSTVAIFTTSDSIMGKPLETFVEETQCNLYEEIQAELDARYEEEVLTKPKAKEGGRNYGTMKKVSKSFKIINLKS